LILLQGRLRPAKARTCKDADDRLVAAQGALVGELCQARNRGGGCSFRADAVPAKQALCGRDFILGGGQGCSVRLAHCADGMVSRDGLADGTGNALGGRRLYGALRIAGDRDFERVGERRLTPDHAWGGFRPSPFQRVLKALPAAIEPVAASTG